MVDLRLYVVIVSRKVYTICHKYIDGVANTEMIKRVRAIQKGNVALIIHFYMP